MPASAIAGPAVNLHRVTIALPFITATTVVTVIATATFTAIGHSYPIKPISGRVTR